MNAQIQKIGSQPAHPVVTATRVSDGLTKREYIATQLMAALITSRDGMPNASDAVIIALTYTDALIAGLRDL